MRRLVAGVVLMLCAMLPAYAQTQAEKDRAIKYLEDTKQGVVAATAGLSPAQWNFRPGPDRWSVAEVTEHIAAAEDYIFGMLSAQVMKAPLRPEGDDVKAIDELVLTAVPDRTNKKQAPEPLRPTNRFGSPDASLRHFLEARHETIDFLKNHDDLRAHATDSPMGKKLDAYEWLLFISAHSERHTKQINEVKADPNFPRN